MICCGIPCCERAEHLVLLLGKEEYKKEFMKNVLKIDYEDSAYGERKLTFKSTPIVLQSLDVGDNLDDVIHMHSKMACGIVYLSDNDTPANYDNCTLFVLFGQQSKQIPDDRTITASVTNGSYDDATSGFTRLVERLNKH